jgi:hypothetical protein
VPGVFVSVIATPENVTSVADEMPPGWTPGPIEVGTI